MKDVAVKCPRCQRKAYRRERLSDFVCYPCQIDFTLHYEGPYIYEHMDAQTLLHAVDDTDWENYPKDESNEQQTLR